MKINFKLLLAMCALAMLTACGNNTSPTSSMSDTGSGSPLGSAPGALTLAVDAYTPPASGQQSSPMRTRDLSAAPTPTSITLGAPLSGMSAVANATAPAMGKPLQVGFGREVVQTSSAAATKQVLKWQTTPSGGHAAAVSLSSTGAKGLRIGLLVTKLPEAATLRYYTKGAAAAHVVAASEVLSTLARNLAAGDTTDAGRTYWGPLVDGAESTLEIELPAGVSTDSVEVAIPEVSHFFMSASTASAISAQSTGTEPLQSLSCQVDISCTTRPAVSDAVSALFFMNGGSSYMCSGTLLNNTASNGVPYVLTANHCISDQTAASTVHSTWFYRSVACNSTTYNFQNASFNYGATLKYTAYDSDSTLLLLNDAPPTGVMFAGWDATPQGLSSVVTGIHHPQGDSQRISSGTFSHYFTRDTSNSNGFYGSNIAASSILGVTLTSGLMEPGSSGSGLFKNVSTNPQLVGQLFGGQQGACSTATTSNPQLTVYGRFDTAFKAGVRTWLSPAAAATNPNRQPVYRFYNGQANVYFYTISSTERDTILATLSNTLKYEGVAFFASPSAAAGFSPIYRFRNNLNGSYFYTISPAEYNTITQYYPQYAYEGIAWYAEPSAAGGGMPLYRFRTNNNSHIYTSYESERSSIINNYPSFVFEGPAYYVHLTP